MGLEPLGACGGAMPAAAAIFPAAVPIVLAVVTRMPSCSGAFFFFVISSKPGMWKFSLLPVEDFGIVNRALLLVKSFCNGRHSLAVSRDGKPYFLHHFTLMLNS